MIVLEEGIERSIFHTVIPGGSFGSSTLRAQIGLGKASEIKEVKVHWAGSNVTQTIKDLKLNTFYKITENRAEAEKLELQPILL